MQTILVKAYCDQAAGVWRARLSDFFVSIRVSANLSDARNVTLTKIGSQQSCSVLGQIVNDLTYAECFPINLVKVYHNIDAIYAHELVHVSHLRTFWNTNGVQFASQVDQLTIPLAAASSAASAASIFESDSRFGYVSLKEDLLNRYDIFYNFSEKTHLNHPEDFANVFPPFLDQLINAAKAQLRTLNCLVQPAPTCSSDFSGIP